ncbi:hypothetical protein [Peptacetobacter sp.]|uniref:hypothetical protein n=1 Tax=Peptacetobacter sp. TaxID=2991975 RepID=UPI0026044824|nr:hypothetical protein [Peptacetobacter sp.]
MAKSEVIKARNTSYITKEDYVESVKLSTNRKIKTVSILLSIILVVVGGYGAVTASIAYGIAFAIFGFVMLIWELFISYNVLGSKSYKKVVEENGTDKIKLKIDFYKDHLVINNQNGLKSELKYRKIQRMGRGENVVVLVFNKDYAVTFKKDGFTYGNYDIVEDIIYKARGMK